ncbi:MAG: hypothetical protein LBD58_02680 [Treponema sp.]|nr:hypothetical protein [Treponema sp.]
MQIKQMKEACEGINGQHEMKFLEMGAEGGSRAFSGTAGAVMRSGEDSHDDKEYNGKGNIWKAPRREGTVMGGGGVFRADGHFAGAAGGRGGEYVTTNRARPQGAERRHERLRKTRDGDQPALFD